LKNPIRIGLHTGQIPDTTFIDLLIESLAKSRFEISVFGFRNHNRRATYSSNVRTFVIPRTVSGRMVYSFRYFILLLFTNPRVLWKWYLMDVKTWRLGFSKKLGEIAQILPVLYVKPDIIHFQWIKSMMSFKHLKEIVEIKTIVSLRGAQISIAPFIDSGWKANYKLVFDEIDGIHSISDDLSNQAIAIGANPSIIVKIHPAISIKKFPFRGGKPLNKVVEFITVARLNWKKGFIYLFEALCMLKAANIDFKYRIIGNGKQQEELLFLAHELKLTDCIIFINTLPHDEIVNYLNRSDYFILPSVQEGFSNAVIEAQAVGLPCIVSDAEGLSENVQDKVTGWVVHKRDSQQLYNVLVEAAKLDSEQLFRMQHNANYRVLSNFSVDDQVMKYKQFYESVSYK